MIKRWLAKSLSTSQTNIDNIMREEKATTYLWVWSIFEQRVFNGFVRFPDLQNKAKEISGDFNSLGIDSIVNKFYSRYQNPKTFNNLKHKENAQIIKELLSKDFDILTDEQKMLLVLYVAYRYRNNIFHGNKGVMSWVHYTEQINDCITVMMKITDIVVEKGGDR